MKHRYKLHIVLVGILLLCLQSNILIGQTNSDQSTSDNYEQLNREEWQEMVDNADYWRNKKKKKKKEKRVTKTRRGGEINLGFLQYLFIGGAIALIVLILLKVFASELFIQAKKLDGDLSFSLEDIEANLAEAPLQKLLRESIEAKNYKLAIRIYYLIVLQDLNKKQLIKWHKEKTNAHYLKELRQHLLSPKFKIVTTIFEHIWYGPEEEVSQREFQQIQPAFDDFIGKIKQA